MLCERGSVAIRDLGNLRCYVNTMAAVGVGFESAKFWRRAIETNVSGRLVDRGGSLLRTRRFVYHRINALRSDSL